jgi:hypothetical protein
MAADQNTHTRRDHAATPDTRPTTMINLGYVALGQDQTAPFVQRLSDGLKRLAFPRA